VCDRVDRGRRAARFPVTLEPRSGPAPDLVVERADGTELRIAARSGKFTSAKMDGVLNRLMRGS